MASWTFCNCFLHREYAGRSNYTSTCPEDTKMHQWVAGMINVDDTHQSGLWVRLYACWWSVRCDKASLECKIVLQWRYRRTQQPISACTKGASINNYTRCALCIAWRKCVGLYGRIYQVRLLCAGHICMGAAMSARV